MAQGRYDYVNCLVLPAERNNSAVESTNTAVLQLQLYASTYLPVFLIYSSNQSSVRLACLANVLS